MQKHILASFAILAVLLQPALAQSSSELEELRRLVQAQREQIQLQQQQLEAIEKRLEALARPAPALPASPLVATAVATAPVATAAAVPPVAQAKAETPRARAWYEKFSFRGYTQFRTNRLMTTNSRLVCELCDRSLGANQNLFIRRARFILSGDITDRIFLYFQPDFATLSTGLHFGQIRDLYFDIALDKKKEFRIRAGQSKVPFGFDNMQSSSNRLALDRTDAINSAAPNERDLGAYLYWAPAKIRQRFAEINNRGLKGSGDYGVFGAGVYNGQTSNRPEANNNMHAVARVAYPWQLKNGQFIEAGIQAYSGRYAVTADQRTAGTTYPIGNFLDRRAAGTFVLYPQPFGIQAEYNFGVGPQYSAQTQRIELGHPRGGYIQTMFRERFHGQQLMPYYRYQTYSGGKKIEMDVRYHLVRSHDVGLEWQPNQYLEFTTEFDHATRRTDDATNPNNRQTGSTLRLQLQVNY